MTHRSFFEIWARINGETPIKNFTQLAEVVESSKQSVSRKKNEDEFPVEWAFKVSQKFNVNTDWIMSGEGPKRLGDNTTAPDREKKPKGIIEEWIKDVREKEGNDGRLVMDLADQVPEFKKWYKEKKSKSSGAETGLPRENVA